MSDLKISLDVKCDECGELLFVSQSCYTLGQITITPCEKCLQEAHQYGIEEEKENAARERVREV